LLQSREFTCNLFKILLTAGNIALPAPLGWAAERCEFNE